MPPPAISTCGLGWAVLSSMCSSQSRAAPPALLVSTLGLAHRTKSRAVITPSGREPPAGETSTCVIPGCESSIATVRAVASGLTVSGSWVIALRTVIRLVPISSQGSNPVAVIHPRGAPGCLAHDQDGLDAVRGHFAQPSAQGRVLDEAHDSGRHQIGRSQFFDLRLAREGPRFNRPTPIGGDWRGAWRRLCAWICHRDSFPGLRRSLPTPSQVGIGPFPRFRSVVGRGFLPSRPAGKTRCRAAVRDIA
jgi:hypothetical protein